MNILVNVESAFDNYDATEIMEWSNHIIHSASIYQDKLTTLVATIIYSIGKIMSKGKIKRYPQQAWNEFETTVRDELSKAIKVLKKDELKDFKKALLVLQKAVMALDKSFKQYINYVINHAKLKKGAKIFEHGVSIKRVASLLGVSEWELRDYAGKTRILERDKFRNGVADRLKKARELFK